MNCDRGRSQESDLRMANKFRGMSLNLSVRSSLRFRPPFIALRRGRGKPGARRRIDSYTNSSRVRSQRKYVSAGLLGEIQLNRGKCLLTDELTFLTERAKSHFNSAAWEVPTGN